MLILALIAVILIEAVAIYVLYTFLDKAKVAQVESEAMAKLLDIEKHILEVKTSVLEKAKTEVTAVQEKITALENTAKAEVAAVEAKAVAVEGQVVAEVTAVETAVKNEVAVVE